MMLFLPSVIKNTVGKPIRNTVIENLLIRPLFGKLRSKFEIIEIK